MSPSEKMYGDVCEALLLLWLTFFFCDLGGDSLQLEDGQAVQLEDGTTAYIHTPKGKKMVSA